MRLLLSIDEHPIIQALKLRGELKPPNSPFGPDFSYSLLIKQVSVEEREDMYKKLIYDSAKVVMTFYDLVLIFSKDDFVNISNLISSNQVSEINRFILLLNVCVQYTCQCGNEQNQISLHQIFTWLNTFPIPPEHKNITDWMFYFVVNSSIKEINKFPLSDYIEEMNTYLSSITEPHPFYVASLIDWIKENQVDNPQLVTSNFIEALDYMQKILNEYPTLRDNEMLSEISGPLTPFLLNLDPLPLLFLSKIAPCFESDLFKPLVQFIFKGFSKISEEEPVNLKFSYDDLPKTAIIIDIKEEITRFQPSSEAFDKIFEYKYPNIEKFSISKFIPKTKYNLLKIIGLISNNLQDCSIPCIQQTLDSINSNQKIPQYLDLCLYLITISIFIQGNNCQNIFKSLFDTIIFNPCITLFHDKDNESVNSILHVRTFCMKSIFRFPTLIYEIFEKNVKYPEMFCELVLRLKDNLTEVCDEALISGKLIHSFSISMRYSIHNSFKNNEREICEKNVCSIFTFLKELEKQKVNNPIVIKSWLSNEEFFFNFIDCTNCHFRRLFVFNAFRMKWDYFSDEKSIVSELMFLQNIFANQYESLDKNEQEILLFDTIQFIKMAITDFKETIKYLSKNIEMICYFLPKVSTDEHGLNIIVEFIQLIYCLLDSVPITPVVIESIVKGSLNVTKGVLNEMLITSLISAASGHVFEEVSSKFIIKTPIFIKIMCEIYIDTDSASNIFAIVQNLCKFSRDNAKLCHKIGIDMLLLSFINKKKFDKYLPKSYVPALELLSCIATVSSSTPVVSGFISLFCPDSTKHLSQYHSIFIDRMIMLIKDNSNTGELSFKEVLFRFCKPQIILPLFAQLDLQFVDDMPLPPYSDAISHLLSSILVASQECQISFYESHGFQIISYLLLQANPGHLTSTLYDSFVSLFEKINNLDLKSVLFESILSNILLWSRSTHSTTVLPNLFTFCSKNEKLSQKYMIFQEITLKTNILFYYTAPIRAIPKFQISKLDPAIRYMIEKFLFDAKRNKFTSDDINFLVSQCLVLEDRQVFADTLRMLELVIESDPKPYLPQDLDAIMNLHQLFSSGDMCITIDLIDFMIKLHKIKPLSFTSNVHANIIANLLPDSLLNQEFLNRLIEKSEKVQEYVPLVFYIASKSSLNYSGIFTKRPKPIDNAISDWAFWPCVCAVINGITKAGSILDYLVASFDRQDFQILFNTLSIVCEIIGVDKEPFLRALLEKQIFYVLNLNNQEIAGKIFDFAICQIFFRKSCMSSQISRVFSSSDYELSQYMDESKDEIGEFPSSRRIIAVLEKIIKREDKFVFGISLNKDENWDDMNIPVILNELCVSSTSQMRSRALAISFAFAMQTDMKDAAMRILMKSKDNGLISDEIDLSSDEIQCQKLKVSTNNNLKEFIDEYMPLVLQNEKNYKLESQRLFDFIKSSEQIFEKHFTMFDLSLVVRAKKDIDTLIENFESTTNENRKYWYRTWNTLTFDRAPWVSALPVVEKHYKRDSNLYGLQIPCKLKVNKKFDDHKLASLKRDIGSKDAAEQIYENIKQNKLSNGTEIIKPETNEKEEYDTNKVIEIECELITIKKTMKSRFLLSSDTLSILNTEKTIHIKSNQVKMMLFRLILHKPHGIEIFLKSGKTILINIFKNSLNFLKNISKIGNWNSCLIQTIPMEQFFQQQKVTESWVVGQRSNFAYLMALNIFSGRSFNDLSMYPVFPWIVKDYDSEILDLNNFSFFRDLSKPIGTISEKRLNNLKEHAESLEEIGQEPYLYTSCFVSPLTVILWLIRIEPFTSLHVDIQGGKFDHPHRIFSSVRSAFQQSTSNDNDFRELIPEFFFSPEFLLNTNGFDFGTLNGKQINDVELPNWAKNNPYKFVYLHRKCLESDYVSSHLNEWIDLIWGCKQESPENKYLPGMYSNIYDKIPQNESRKLKEIENVKKLIGQIPPQLFDKPHPVKKNYINQKAVKSEVKSHVDVKSEIIFTYFANKDIGVQGFTVLSDGTISRILLNIFSKDNLSIPLSSRFKTIGNCFSFCFNSQLFLMAKEDGHITIIDCGLEQTTIELERHIGSVNCLSVDGNYLVSGGNDTAINIWNLSKNREKILILFSLPTFRAEIVSIDVCQSFGICAALTSDGALFIVSINYGDVRKIVDLGRNPTKVIISKYWGFIAVFSSAVIESKSVNFLSVFSINGEKLNESELNFDVSCVCTMTTQKGFDYLIIADTIGNIFLSETFYATVELIFRKKVNKIVSIGYLNERDCICYATKDGIVGIIPFSIENKL